MMYAVLYRWKLKPGRLQDFKNAWAEGTRLLHENCGSYGACLHEGPDDVIWSYARWPSDDVRKACFEGRDWFSHDCFKTMQDCVEERFDEISLDVLADQLAITEDETSGPSLAPIPVLTTERLVLRPMTQADIEPLWPALKDEANMKYWSRGPIDTLEEARAYLQWNIKSEGVSCFTLAPLTEPDQALGWVVLMHRKSGVAEIGYLLHPEAHGQGYAREAVETIIKYGFENLEYRRIYADVDPDNAPSIRLLEVLGFEFEGRMRESWETHIGVRDSCIYSRLATT